MTKMSAKILLHLLILYGVLCQGMTSTSPNDHIQESSALLARDKRVVNLEEGAHQNVLINQANYMTIITQNNRANCAGVILSHYTIITAAICALHEASAYSLGCGSAYPGACKIHAITSINSYYGNPPHENTDGIALLTVDPPFVFDMRIGSLQLHEGPIPPNTEAIVNGWGCRYALVPIARVRNLHRRLRQITVPIMNHRECQNIYQQFFRISNKHICTHHEQRYCAYTDIGAPLVVNDRLAGIHVYKGEFYEQLNPDIFVDLTLPEYSEWIKHHTLLM